MARKQGTRDPHTPARPLEFRPRISIEVTENFREDFVRSAYSMGLTQFAYLRMLQEQHAQAATARELAEKVNPLLPTV